MKTMKAGNGRVCITVRVCLSGFCPKTEITPPVISAFWTGYAGTGNGKVALSYNTATELVNIHFSHAILISTHNLKQKHDLRQYRFCANASILGKYRSKNPEAQSFEWRNPLDSNRRLRNPGTKSICLASGVNWGRISIFDFLSISFDGAT
jgi:hypothetical protein